jgi:hypothetical protein
MIDAAAELRKRAEQMAKALGIALYIKDGRISQKGPGEFVEKPAGSEPQPMGSGTIGEQK